jgi:hypothetical protein
VPLLSSPLNPLSGLKKTVTYRVTRYKEEKNQVSCKTSSPHWALRVAQGLEVVISALTCQAKAPGATVALANAKPKPAWVSHVVRGWVAMNLKSETP